MTGRYYDEFTEFERDIDTRVRATLPATRKPVSPIFYELWWNDYFNKELEDDE